MSTHFLLEAPVGLLPVLAFLATLLHFDSYRLVNLKEIVGCLVAGLALAAAAYFINGAILQLLAINVPTYSHTLAPAVEEGLKATAVLYLFLRNRIGFMIDAAILGFAVGTGFSLFENIYYLHAYEGANIGVWIVRGFGTAIMHGGATALFALVSQSFIEEKGAPKPVHFLLGLLPAIALHLLFNLIADIPLLPTAVVLFGLPPLFYLTFSKNEHAVHQWLVDDYKSHAQLLDEINSGAFRHSEAGRFILELSRKFSPAMVEDVFTYLKLHTQLVLRAEQLALARERQEAVEPAPQNAEDLRVLHELEKRIGASAMMALWPHLHFSRRELWEMHALYGA
ncbi:MAG: PrsW family intramembrane metalloprotease [Alphaproteobacteria bacterium]|nr:PrsW family intramembrane metalloprotease [Alphaproteobacteria bacterium]MBV9541797.1 PrsW family intramembrane metalloprotease [Alphaproteobacteria bacterium]